MSATTSFDSSIERISRSASIHVLRGLAALFIGIINTLDHSPHLSEEHTHERRRAPNQPVSGC